MRRFLFLLVSTVCFALTAQAQKSVTEYFNEGIQRYRNAEYKAAIQSFNKVLELNPKFIEAYGNMGNAKFRLGDYKGAKADYDIVLESNPNDA